MSSGRSHRIGFVQDGTLLQKVAFSHGEQTAIVIGKASNCEVCITNSFVSKEHAQLIHNNNNELFILDLNSTNGTFLNEKKIQPGVPYPIKSGDRVDFTSSGNVKLVFDPDNYQSSKAPWRDPNIGNSGDIFGTTDIIEKIRLKGKIIIGRGTDCDIILPGQQSISRRHASIEKKGDQYFLTDLDSTNGTFLNGRRISGSQRVTEADTIFVGRYQLQLKGRARNLSSQVSIRAENVTKRFKNGVVGLHNSTFEIPAKSLTAVMGPSGCGKSTLLKALNGDSPPSSGRVFISGLDLSENYDYLKTLIGYVPQDDIVHKELTVEQSLYYAAKLRLDHASSEFIDQKIEQVLKDLNIVHIRKNLVRDISGGQRKRVSIAVEILTDPLILFLDEPTSPLDPQTIEEFLGILRKLAENGTTVLMVTHKPEDLSYMDSVIFMAEGGYLVYQGESSGYLSYFRVADVVKVYSELAQPKAKVWIDRRFAKDTNGGKPNTEFKKQIPVNFFSQYFWLTIRYFNIKFNDRGNTAMMLGQAPIIAILICMIFDQVSQAVPFLMAVSAIWFGTNNAAREIVGELPIFKRERMFNQGIFPYILSKITVLGAFAAAQAILFVLIIYVRYQDTNPSWNDPLVTFFWMLSISLAATLMGLLLSSLVKTTEKVMTIVPIVLIPQIMLAGIVAKISLPLVEVISYVTLSRWGTEGFSDIQQEVSVPKMELDTASVEMNQQGQITDAKFIQDGDTTAQAIDELVKNFHSSYPDRFGTWHGTLALDYLIIGILSLLFFIGIYISLKQKDSMKLK
jgi:ABC-type multidrug transport system ATPase subunit